MDKHVLIYSTPTCHFCKLAKEFFDSHSITYTNYDVSTDAAKREEMVQKTGQLGVPVIIIDGQTIIGFNRDKVADALGVTLQ